MHQAHALTLEPLLLREAAENGLLIADIQN